MAKIPEKLMIIVNPASGAGKSLDILPEVENIITELGAQPDIRISKSADHATELAKTAADCGYERIIAIGGDGTVNMVAAGILGSPVVLGIIPAGTGNDFFRMLEIEGDLAAICRNAAKGDTIETDIGRFNGRPFFNMLGIGFDAMVAKSVRGDRRNLGLMTYLIAVYKNLKDYPTNDIKLRIDSYELDKKALLVAIGIGRSTGSGIHLTPSAKLDDNKFDVCLVKHIKPLRLLSLLPRAVKGRHIRQPEVEMYRCRQLEIYSSRPLPIHYEGETVMSDNGKISIKMCRDKLHVAAGVKLTR